ncbi:hypothetical protein DPSP01_002434 [Paraphaeosphaeria sporulosa]|uniref:Uncharacterized protein n=1 Tax=Paraphaeosphaeria sporulosa TaxID=1460663 RepID=A0A177C0I9_9PLEO|nr:uncharacterized protein CC84DRAFT_1221681 [Paraphaeosphaeria sporulosa]OAG01153.1 hypothetical protein CC84DRAFT_1221681 [Paraphaeosphaeria sporulosa]
MTWITTVNVPKALPVFEKHGVVDYVLFDTPATFIDPFPENMAVLKPNWEIAG